MQAAVVHSFDRPPRYETFAAPVPQNPDDVLVQVIAAGLHPRVRSSASGTHYTRTDALPMIPGIDGVGRRPDGQLVYFVAPDTAFGSMAEQVVVDRRSTVPLPDAVDPVAAAAAMLPAMSSWMALRKRIGFQAGQSVLILGATGSAGQMAIQVARILGAKRVIAAGRNTELFGLLKDLGADTIVAMTKDLQQTAAAIADAADVDVVLDYVWGAPAEAIMPALLRARTDRSAALDWVHIGSVAGPEVDLRSEWLRAANFRIQGSGQGSLSTAGIVAELPALVHEFCAGQLRVDAKAVPLSDVEAAWDGTFAPGQRVVFTTSPGPAE